MKRFNKTPDDADAEKVIDLDTRSNVLRDSGPKCGLNLVQLMGFFVLCLMLFSVLFSVSVVLRDPPSDGVAEAFAATTVFEAKQSEGLNKDASDSVDLQKDELLGGLLAAGFDERSCLSRYQSILYGKGLLEKPSSYLISRLRKYEARHKECGPYTESYNKTVKELRSGHFSGPSDCKYVVWISFSGLGNRILTLASAFLYALLTDRVLLVDPRVDMTSLFCEPFPEVSWFLPSDFPLTTKMRDLNPQSARCYGKMLKNKSIANLTVPSYVYLHLAHDYDDHDKLFFCDEDQSYLHKIPWLMMKTDNYFIPTLFLMPSFEQELNDLFPNKETIFHFLGRYLFHPTNRVWGLVTRYYQAYLAKADERLGIQIRVLDTGKGPFKHVLDQILSCTLKENLLPDVNKQQDFTSLPSGQKRKSKAVMMTSLSSGYSEEVRNMYWEYPTVTGEVVSIFQPSHEEHQQTEKQMHNQKAWAEMYLLSLTDVLVTSGWSTFGYVAQGLGGLKPWILYKPENGTAPDPPCRRAMSMEPCFHAPPFYDCKAKKGIDTGVLVPHVRHCEDMSWGLKLVDN
ncbi:galactoside 2-alpha-L-fucosyltransferase-like [Senna tora]|uniref:Fucosyltransferase n=1 Tax=Senna tora TaxID=362788 RepID=A0A834W553_9FABA|nr:galactoside 2-alpha-L-fucosyltransferase-like [Senna tora]